MTTYSGTIPAELAREEHVTRFDIHQRVQHFFLMVSFTLLVLTGMPLKFAESGISKWWISVLGGVEPTRLIHRGAAWVMIAVCVYHALYLLYGIIVLKKKFTDIFPTKNDFILFFQEMAYFTGLRKERPRFPRYNWREKFDYYAMFWGIPVMALTGLVMMFPVVATRFLPGWVLPVALIAHSDESMLALTWIVVVHVFFNHFVPGVFPFNPSIFTGKLSKERYKVDHPVEYEKLTGQSVQSKEGN
ncbi:MAG: cytochrome b/b6 domain-containing protein [Dehalococcoidia bacterium]|nr:cytochrome b/b6 domain-containing protein [Dehalococcoidia bacterium]